MIYTFDEHSLDLDRRELRRGSNAIAIEPQVFDLLQYLIENRTRVVGKDDLLRAIWKGRVVSESTLSSRIAALRRAVGDDGERQRVIRTIARKGFRFVGHVDGETASRPPPDALVSASSAATRTAAAASPPSSPATAIAPSPERRQLTIVACSIGGADRLDPEDVRQLLSDCHARIVRIAQAHRGVARQSAPNTMLIHFGYPVASEQDAERAVRAGFDIVAAIAAASPDAESPGFARIGIDTGLVVVADRVRASDGHDLEVVGQPVDGALQAMQRAPASAVVITDSTRRLVGKLFAVRSVAPAAPRRGRTDALAAGAWEVLHAQPIADRFEALRAAPAPLIGRDEEIALLVRRWEQVCAGTGRVVLIWGEAGIGKSHLVAGLQDAIGREQPAVLRFFCSPHRTDTALHPVVTHLEDAAGFRAVDDDATKRAKLGRLLATSALDDRNVPLFAELLSIGTGMQTALSAQRRKELLLERFVALVDGRARAAPVLIVLEDAHWIDPTTRELFDLLVERVTTMRALFVMTYRPEFAPPWLGQAHVTTLTLTRLDRTSNLALVARVAGGKALPPELVDEILAKADGVPLFVEEVTKSVLESGIVRETAGCYVRVAPHSPVAVPSTLQASLVARIDRLAAIRPLVQTCAALGRTFGYRLVRAVTTLADSALEPALEQLVGSGLVHQRGAPPDAQYAFKHALVQEAAYETMLRAQRADIHRHIAGVLRSAFPDIPARNPDLLAHHCTEGGLWEQAIEYSIAAARMAVERSAGVESEARVERALALLPNVASAAVRTRLEGRLKVAHADALIMTQGFASPRVNDALTEARALLRQRNERDDRDASLRALCGLFNYHLIRSESPSCLALVTPLLERRLARPQANVVRYLAGTAHLHLGEFDATIRHLEAARALYDDGACRDVAFVAGYHLHSFTLIWLGLAYLYVGAFEAAASTISAAVADARRRAHPFTLVSALLAEARFRSHRNDLAAAIAATEEGFAIATEQRSPYHVSRASILRAVNALDAGNAPQAIGLMESALVAHRATGANFQSSYNLTRLAEAYARAGRHAQALPLADAAIAEVKRCGERWWEAEAERLRGEILLLADPRNADAAERCFARSRATAKRQRARLWEINAANSLASSWMARGREADARKLLASLESSSAG